MSMEAMKRALAIIVCILIFSGVAWAVDLDCRVVVRDMYAADSHETQNQLVAILRGNELEGVAKLLSSGQVTLFETGEKVFTKEKSVWGYDKVSRPGETKTWLLAPQNSRPCDKGD
jgi:hypothetical protein